MSRFLDAMRGQGKAVDADDSDRTYKGEIVDADDVLGPRVKNHSSNIEPAELSIQPVDADPDATAPMTDAADPFDSAAPDHQVDQREQIVHSGQGPEGGTATAHANNAINDKAAARASSSGSPSINAAGTQQSTVIKSSFSQRSFDPLFYLIVGISSVGLFACLYALITQNDAYFEREYQQLQKESSALQARLAASERLEEALTAAVSAQNTTLTSAAVLAPATVAGKESDAQGQVASGETQAPLLSVIETPEPIVEIVLPETDAEVVASSDPEPVVEVEESNSEFARETVKESASEAALVLLRQEVEDLRAAMNDQDNKISRLEKVNLELTSILDSSKTDVRSDTETPVRLVSQHKDQTALPSVNVPAEVLGVTREGVASTPQPNLRSATIESPLLSTLKADTASEITDLVRQGYFAYQAQDYTAASGFYGKALEFDPYDRDANLGVAATAQVVGKTRLAEDRYRHLLTLDPADEVAFSALLNLPRPGDQGSIIEYELTQHAVYVSNPYKLYAILGNYYSQQKRWSEAESAYAIAIDGSSNNPDILFNYAVTLDNIGRTAQAAEYYSRALEGIETAPHTFDADAAGQRLQSIVTDGQ